MTHLNFKANEVGWKGKIEGGPMSRMCLEQSNNKII